MNNYLIIDKKSTSTLLRVGLSLRIRIDSNIRICNWLVGLPSKEKLERDIVRLQDVA